jgi:hypothetical protein
VNSSGIDVPNAMIVAPMNMRDSLARWAIATAAEIAQSPLFTKMMMPATIAPNDSIPSS